MLSTYTESIKIVLGTILLAILYGIAHDIVTAHIYVEYFTKFHPHIIDSESPMAMALLWGVIATWWMGLLIGIPIAASARFGQNPRLSARQTLLKLAKGTAAVYLAAMITLLIALPLCKGRIITLQPDPEDRSGRFLAVLITHNVSYFLSAVVALGLCIHCVILRQKLRPVPPPFQNPIGPDA